MKDKVLEALAKKKAKDQRGKILFFKFFISISIASTTRGLSYRIKSLLILKLWRRETKCEEIKFILSLY